jgi:hypothetical protein
MMKLRFLGAALVLLAAFAATGRADQFSDIANSPNTYWVPPPSGYAPAPGPYYYYGGPPPGYYPPPAPPPPPVPAFFIHFHFH